MHALISKSGRFALRHAPNMPDYRTARGGFDWRAERARLTGSADGPVNIGFEALDRNVQRGRGGQVAVRFLGREGRCEELTYAALLAAASRCANALATLGVGRGERVYALLGRGPALHTVALASLRSGRVFCPLFSAFGPEPVRMRLELGGARVLVTTPALYERKVAPIRGALAQLRHVLLVRAPGDPAALPDATLDFGALLAAAGDACAAAETGPEDPALLHFTSGTTGQPKGVLHVHEAVVAQYASARLALDIQPQDRYWCTADPGWVTGMAYGVIAPLLLGATSIVDEEEFDPERWYRILDEERVSVWYTAPTAIRMLMKAGVELARSRRYRELRFLASVGEPLNPEAVVWGCEAFGLPFHDNWWQTETGGIMIANFASVDIRPGSMGLPLPGIEAAILRTGDAGGAARTVGPGEVGELALRRGWPSMFRGYLGNEARYRACFAGDWYRTGDLARRDADGYYWFVGRSDDVIKSAGHLISPFEVESVLLAHPSVAQAGVIGVPDPVAGATVKAFVELKSGFDGDAALRRDLLALARRQLGAAIAPRDIAFVASLPRTRSGKIMRRVLRSRELGLPEGDLSTLEAGA
ncbi:MAG: acetate--CoA ligase [Steroidobacteraceae bacterium]